MVLTSGAEYDKVWAWAKGKAWAVGYDKAGAWAKGKPWANGKPWAKGKPWEATIGPAEYDTAGPAAKAGAYDGAYDGAYAWAYDNGAGAMLLTANGAGAKWANGAAANGAWRKPGLAAAKAKRADKTTYGIENKNNFKHGSSYAYNCLLRKNCSITEYIST